MGKDVEQTTKGHKHVAFCMGGEIDVLGEVEAIREKEEVRGEGRVGLVKVDVEIANEKEADGKRGSNSEKVSGVLTEKKGEASAGGWGSGVEEENSNSEKAGYSKDKVEVTLRFSSVLEWIAYG